MAKPISIPNTFAGSTSAIPLVYLDQDFTAVSNATNDLATYSNYVVDTGVADAYIANYPANIVTTTVTAGLRLQFKASNANTGASNLQVQVNSVSIGSGAIRLTDGSALPANTIVANAIVDVQYDGTNFQLLSDSNGGQQTMTNLSLTGNLAVTGTSSFTGNVTINGGTANNVVAGNINISSVQSTFPNSFLANSTSTLGNATVTLGGTTSSVGNLTLTLPTVTNYVETLYSVTGNTTVSLSNGTIQKITTSGTTTITLPSSVSGKSFTIIVSYAAADSITWAGGSTLKWASSTTPTPTSATGKLDIFNFYQDGTNTYGSIFGQNY